MRMQVILDFSFALPGSAPIWGGKKGEFRDWTRQRYSKDSSRQQSVVDLRCYAEYQFFLFDTQTYVVFLLF